MPTSTEIFKDAIFQHIKTVAGYDPRLQILDVGPGEGTFGKGLQPLRIDALEIYQPYIDEFDLKSIYRNVFCGYYTNYNKWII